jgi:hypothetical protein
VNRRRTFPIAAGALWGTLGGAVAAAAALVFAFGFLWLFVVGDAPPPARGRLFILAPVLAVMVFGICVAAGVMIGAAAARRAERRVASDPDTAAREDRRAANALALAALALLVSAGLVGLKVRQTHLDVAAQRRDAAQRHEAQRRFEETRFFVADLVVSPRVGGEGHDLTLVLRGRQGGVHHLTVIVREDTYHRELFRHEENLQLAPGERSLQVFVDKALLARRYSERILSGPGKVLVKESFTVEATLVPEGAGLHPDLRGRSDAPVTRPLPVEFRVEKGTEPLAG